MAHQTYQVRGYCSPTGYERLDEVNRECARLYNAALQEWRDAYQVTSQWREKGTSPSLYDQMKQFTQVRADDPEGWGGLSQHVGRGVLRRLERARQAFFRRVKAGQKPGYPRFRSSRRWSTVQMAEVTAGMVRETRKHYIIRIKGLPDIRLRKQCEFPSPDHLVGIRITRRPSRRILVALTYEVEQAVLPANIGAVGVDMGVSDRMGLSSGEAVSRRKRDTSIEKKQKRLSACKKGSRERRKRALTLANAHYRERVRNRNECHRITTDLVKRYGTIAIEDLQVQNMTRSAKGTVESPGTKVAQKRGLNREINSQTWGMIRQQLTYKAEWAGRELVVVDPKYTSQDCSACGVRDASSRRGKVYQCTSCGMVLDADVNAARNILSKALLGRNFPEAVLDAA